MDYDAAHLWITLAELAVDYGPAALWITMLRICGLVECGGWLRPPRPSGRTESCTLRILRMLSLVLTGRRGGAVGNACRRRDTQLNNGE